MIEAYALLAAFTVQILTMSVLCPAWLTRYCRAQASKIPADRVAKLYPGSNLEETLGRILTQYNVMNMIIAALGLLPLGWLFSYTQRPDWDDGPIEALVSAYFMVQALPFGVLALMGHRYRKVLKQLMDGKRTASLQRRGIFDFVSPFTVFVAVLGYVLFVAYVLYIQQNPFPGFQAYITLAVVTFGHVLNSFIVYRVIYGNKANPFETHENRVRMMGLTVRTLIYSLILIDVFLSLNFTLVLQDLQRWEPFAQCVFLAIVAILGFRGFVAPLRRSEPEALTGS